MAHLTPEQQAEFVGDDGAVFVHENGAWGRHGSSRGRLEDIDQKTSREALTLAWQNVVRRPGESGSLS